MNFRKKPEPINAHPTASPELAQQGQSAEHHTNRPTYQRELSDLQTTLLDLAQLVNTAIDQGFDALKTHDLTLARQVIEADKLINQRRYELEEDALNLLALQQPVVSHDLRYTAAILHMSGELERIGDYAKGLAISTLQLSGLVAPDIMASFEEMVQKSQTMLKKALTAFAERDVAAAQAVISDDDEVDVLYNEAYHALLKLMLVDPTRIDEATRLVRVAHNLERLADRVTNICERIIFVETGAFVETQHQAHQ
jgi:phosphate transport system protein